MWWIIDSRLNGARALITFQQDVVYARKDACTGTWFTELGGFYRHVACTRTVSIVTPKDSINNCLWRFSKSFYISKEDMFPCFPTSRCLSARERPESLKWFSKSKLKLGCQGLACLSSRGRQWHRLVLSACLRELGRLASGSPNARPLSLELRIPHLF